MVLYFSGTGNSRYAARGIAEHLGDEAISISDGLRSKKPGNYHSVAPFVIVCPSHMSRMPMDVEAYLERCTFSGSKKAYFVFTAGQAVGNAWKYCKKLCAKRGLTYMGTAAIAMPANYVVMYDVTPKAQARQAAAKADSAIAEVAAAIKAGKTLEIAPSMAGHKSFSAIAPLFHATMVSAKGFHANERCTGCGACVQACPLGTITLQGQKPAWDKACMHCMACISICPQSAIDYGKKTAGRNRYYLKD